MVDLSVPHALQDEFRQVKTRAELEAKRDFIRNETFRRDIWIKGEPLKSEEEWLAINREQVFGTIDPLSKIDQTVAFGDIQLSYQNEPFAAMLKLLAERALSIGEMEDNSALAGLSPWTRFEAARFLAAGGQVHAFPHSTAPVKVAKDARLSMPAINRGMIKELGTSMPKIALAAPNAGTGIELGNIDAILLLARCEKGREAAVKIAMKIIGGENGEAMIGNKTLSQAQAEALLKDRFTALENTMLDKLAEIGVVSVEG
jgi:hypothetical protein